jgi:MFS family permease
MATEAVDRRRWTLVAVCVTTFMLLLDITVVNVALPRFQSSLSAGLTGLQWVVDAYAQALAALILTAGALADRYGRRLMFIFGVIVFTAALFATALALIGHEYRGRDLFGAIAIWAPRSAPRSQAGRSSGDFSPTASAGGGSSSSTSPSGHSRSTSPFVTWPSRVTRAPSAPTWPAWSLFRLRSS